MPLRNDLLNPISPDKPSGDNLYYAPVYDKIKEARRQDDDAPQGLWQHERKVADWPQVIKLSSEALATKTKDLQLAAWLAEAMLKREGIAGFRETLVMIQGLVENFWDTLYPELEDGDAEFRSAPLQWVGERLEIPIKQTALTKSGYDLFRYNEARAVGTEEQANESNEKIAARAAAIAEGKITQEDFDKAFDETPKTFYVNLLETYDSAMEAVSALGETCDSKFGNVSPSFGTVSRALEEMRQKVHILLQKKREKEPDDPVDAPVAEPEPEPVEEPVAVSSYGQAAAPARAPVRKTGALTAEPVDREDAIARVIACAKYLRQQDPYNPAPYMMLRGMRWGELRAGGDSIDALLLAPPPSEIRQALKKAALEGNWTEVLETAETAAGMECGRGWLDLQRYAARACYELGSYYPVVRAAIVSGLRGILKDYPQLVDYTLMDDTPVANAETLAWLKEEVVPPEPEPEAAAAPEPAYVPPSSYEQPVGESAVEAPPDAFELAIQATRRGHPQEGIEILMRELSQARSGRARFQRKSQLAQLCVSAGRQEIASPILTDLASEIERRKLEDWESPDMIAHPLALLYQCMSRDAAPEERQKLYSWICRLDPLQAMNVSK
jgi:type VI secretion system protein ImpA